jgi:hypothetical protein
MGALLNHLASTPLLKTIESVNIYKKNVCKDMYYVYIPIKIENFGTGRGPPRPSCCSAPGRHAEREREIDKEGHMTESDWLLGFLSNYYFEFNYFIAN